MHIHVLSDLHLEFSPFAPQVTAADVVILAGDIHVKGRGVPWARQAFEGPVLYVPGNHEFYGGHLSHTLASMRAEADTRVRVLERDDVVINGTRFLGCTLWTDFTAKGSAHLAALQAHAEMNDFRKIRTRAYQRIVPNDLVQECLNSLQWLRLKLAEPFVGKTVVITHHAPSLRSLADNPHAGNLLDAAYATNCETLMGAERVVLWIHGHSHCAVDYKIAGTRVVCNPRGYPGEETGFDPALVLTL
ncbi:serine/threonine protein phosphatase [Ectopseudomonas mendocina]|uniref:metallophosphoesterase n=1 Tax=Ectopseudomonas oleovorans TaxID=301 RepID=UPI000CF171A6|nr:MULTISPECIES: metallophosphoesterase [Pseudomonas aeruginosa group]PPV34271.1 serine/threonine protein phosphatase [Pseudomonas oleovorans]TRO27384.1 serine/threonine protein phosphatase [Pseudomonas mendocina]